MNVADRMANLRNPQALRLLGGEMSSGEVQKVYATFDAVDAAVQSGKNHVAALNDLLCVGRLAKALGKMTAQETRTVKAVLRYLVRLTEKTG